MKCLLLLASFLFSFALSAQQPGSDAEKRRALVENSLTPDIVYADSILHLNIDSQMAAYHIKGVSIAVIKDYKIDWARGYGFADVKEKRPVTTDTRFQAASISKSLNSLGLLKLVQQNKLSLDTDINTYLKSWKFPYDSLSKDKKITLRHLLTHTAGLSVHGFRGYEKTDTIPTIIQILNGQKPANSPAIKSLFAPGTRFQYSGGGTTISQLMLTDITGQRYEDFMKKQVLDPLGMTNSSFAQPPGNTKNLATAYYGNGEEVKGKYHIYPEQAAAGLWTTPSDLTRYIIETQLAYQGKSQKVLSSQITKDRFAFYIDSFISLGSFLVNKPGETWFSHNGGNEGFVCTSYGSLQNGNGVVVMTNGDNFAIIPEIVNSVATVYNWKNFYTPVFKKVVSIPRDSLQAYSGKYLLGTDTLLFSFCEDELCVWQNGQPENGYKLIFGSVRTATLKEIPNATLTFMYSKEGKIDSLELDQGGVKMKCVKIL